MEKKFLIIANWKSNNPQNWSVTVPENVEVTVAPPFPLLSTLKGYSLCAQNVSVFESGAYTGEVSAEMLKSLNVKYCLVGHSERRKYFGETNAQVQDKINNLIKNNIIPIVCARSFADIVPANFIMYEPEEAISTNGQYHPEEPEKVKEVLTNWKTKLPPETKFLYGGSVNTENAKSFSFTDGLVVGHASLNPETFSQICASF